MRYSRATEISRQTGRPIEEVVKELIQQEEQQQQEQQEQQQQSSKDIQTT